MDETVCFWSFPRVIFKMSFLFSSSWLRPWEMVYPTMRLFPKLSTSHSTITALAPARGQSVSIFDIFTYSLGTLKKIFLKRKEIHEDLSSSSFFPPPLVSFYRGRCQLERLVIAIRYHCCFLMEVYVYIYFSWFPRSCCLFLSLPFHLHTPSENGQWRAVGRGAQAQSCRIECFFLCCSKENLVF